MPDYNLQLLHSIIRPKIHILPYLLVDGFEESLVKWYYAGASGGSLARKTDKAAEGEACLAVQTPGVAADEESRAEIRTAAVHVPILFYARFYFPSNVQKVLFELTNTFDGRWYDAYFAYDIVNQKWQITYPADTWIDVPNGTQKLDALQWHEFMAVVDFEQNLYRYLIANGKIMILDHAIASGSSSEGDNLNVKLGLIGASSATATDASFDNVIVMKLPSLPKITPRVSPLTNLPLTESESKLLPRKISQIRLVPI